MGCTPKGITGKRVDSGTGLEHFEAGETCRLPAVLTLSVLFPLVFFRHSVPICFASQVLTKAEEPEENVYTAPQTKSTTELTRFL